MSYEWCRGLCDTEGNRHVHEDLLPPPEAPQASPTTAETAAVLGALHEYCRRRNISDIPASMLPSILDDLIAAAQRVRAVTR